MFVDARSKSNLFSLVCFQNSVLKFTVQMDDYNCSI